jgi:hypothetical protein
MEVRNMPKKHLLLVIFVVVLSFIGLFVSVGHASSILFSKQTEDELAGSLIYADELSAVPAQTVVHFSAKKANDMLSIEINLSGKRVLVERGYNSRRREFFIGYGTRQSATFLGENERNILRSLITELENVRQDNDLNKMFGSILSLLVNWPEHIALALEMNEEKVLLGSGADATSMTRQEYDSLMATIDRKSREHGSRELSASICDKIGQIHEGYYNYDIFGGGQSSSHLVGGCNCFGRCGIGCPDPPSFGLPFTGNKYTQSCFNHDMCVDHFGYVDIRCDIMFPKCADDYLGAPECSKRPDLAGECSNGGSGSYPGDSCGTGKVYDCSGTCVDQSTAQAWIGDGYCDDANSSYAYDLNCVSFNYDGGDCGGGCTISNGDVDYCAQCGPCGVGEGDCDSDSECQSGLICAQDVGANYGMPSNYDVCENPSGSGTTPGSSCGTGKVYDCSGTCVDQSKAQAWIGDGYCDDGTYGMVLTCSAFSNDGGDCGGGGCTISNGDVDYCAQCGPCGVGEGDCDSDSECQSGLMCVQINSSLGLGDLGFIDVCANVSPGDSCGAGEIYDCQGSCMDQMWLCNIGNGYCDNDGYDFNCASFNYDGGDCVPGGGTPGSSCGTGMFYDCSGTCVSQFWAQGWIGNGVCDDSLAGHMYDLNCASFNYDGGDCDGSGGGD